MKKQTLISYILIVCMLVGVLASCGVEIETTGTTSAPAESETTESVGTTVTTDGETKTDETEDGTVGDSVAPDGTETESDSFASTDSSTDSETESEKATVTEAPEAPKVNLEGNYADSILYADELKNKIQSYYPDGVARDRYYVENADMSAEFALKSGSEQKLTYLKSKSGNTYVSNTMDVFIRMKDNKTYYASDSSNNARANVYRIGYYYYDVRILEQSFYNNVTVTNEIDLDETLFKYGNDMALKTKADFIRYQVTGGDPYFSCANNAINFASDEYDAIQFTIKSSNASNAQLFVITDNKSTYNDKQSILFNVINDGEFHTYTIMLAALPDYSGNVIGFRLDLGQLVNEIIEIQDMKVVKVASDAPYVLLDRTWHTYSDKLHQELHFVAPDGQDNIDAVGMVTNIPTDTVNAIIVKDANATHSSLDNVDWDSVEYVGFDIKDAGIFGYIMPADNGSGKITVTLDGENYVVIQEASPENGEIRAPSEVGNTSNDFYMGHRIYTDETHDFADFIIEAELERNPMKGIQSDKYVKYDALRGAYLFDIGGTSFNPPFFSSWNQHFSTEIKLRSNDSDRKIYIRTVSSTGALENAVLLDGDGLLIPIPLEVSKNFGEGEEPVMNYGDTTYGETLFPLYVITGEKYELEVLNLYQNWGKFPIKQLSSIAYYAPYYHLSCGVTETTCISPWYVRGRTLWTLPDFRSQSAPYWFELEGDAFKNEPQHTHAGVIEIIHYSDANGKFIASENYNNVIDSSGPIYAEVKMDYISDDGKMHITYNHLELPQTDELRAYYEINIDVLEDISFADFKSSFSFYAWNTNRTHVGYLNADGEHKEETYINKDTVTEYVLGKVGGYFGNFGTSSKNSTNLGFVIHSSEIYIGGQLFDGNFVVVEDGENRFRLTLDVAEASFKKGDTITLNILMVPWGSHLSTDASNLAYVRQTSVVDPFKVSASKGEVIDSTYLPRVKSDDGKSAIFTVSGGINNCAVRVYGFEKLTAPKIYELVDDEWQEYTVSSIDSPDIVGIRHYYDGYMTYYDGDGTYSYAFAFNMDDVESRTFKIEATEDFKPWPEVEVVNNDPINVFTDPTEIANKFANAFPGIGSATLSENADYVRLTGDGSGAVEVRIDAYSATSSIETGKYLFVKYRAPSSSPTNNFEFFSGTKNTAPKGEDCIWLNSSFTVCDGEWHVLVVDANSFKPNTFCAADDGKYYANYMSFDVFNTPMSTDDYIDIAYIGMCADLDEFRELDANKDVDTYTLVSKDKNVVVNMKTGEIISGQGGGTVVKPDGDGVTISKNASSLIASDSSYTLSSVKYFGRVDSINGYGPALAIGSSYNSRGSNSTDGVATFKYNAETTDDLRVVLAGWSLAYGGVEKYVWSVDGKNWYEVELYNKSAIGTASSGMINYANKGCGETDFELYSEYSSYQGNLSGPKTASGIAADLSAFEGQTVNVTFALVPKADTASICILAHITGVKVEKSATDDSNDGAPDEVPNPYNDPLNYYLSAEEMNAMLKDSLPKGTGSITLADDGSYIRFFGDGNVEGESFFNAFTSSQKVATGKYIVIKYRMPSTNSEKNHLQIFTSTVNNGAVGSDSIALGKYTMSNDDAWHVIIVDAASFLPSSYSAEGGRFYCKYLRLDVFNEKMSTSSYIDVAYVGIADNIEKIRSLDANADMETLSLITSSKTQFVSVATGEITDNENGTNNPVISIVTNPEQFISLDNAQGYIASDTNYFSRFDAINGLGPAGSSTNAYDMGSNDKEGIVNIKYNGNSLADKKLTLAGWSLVYGGVEKYVWSADGGKTWHDVSYVLISQATNAYTGLYTYTASKYGDEVDFSAYGANSCYQTTLGKPGGLAADLSAYAGQTVNVTFAAVSAENTNELCILIHIEGVKVVE